MAKVTFKGNPMTLVGNEVKVGEQAPNFTVLDSGLQEKTLADYEGKTIVISVIPSIDTGVCEQQTKRFNEEAAKLDNVQVLTISADLPFAQKRWCAAEGVDNLEMLSDHRDFSFAQSFGLGMKELRLLARAVFVIDDKGTIQHAEYVEEATNHPDYDNALAQVNSLIK
ncbi:thiol peroxidase [Geomicrobium sp. JCM 19055]|uniref:thiol peroxidase n=1 Tax=Geomicrobium sp. JCM 19055 TaxID=1460649 RepID=UPI00045ED295|nr:thiol peroxidase [Geomicrobium sp. JCM 19055]GAJ99395.1 thiol peroxidase [Geomicrobium sp. JCM 19055]